MTFKADDPTCNPHIAAWVCDKCNKIHISNVDNDGKVLGQANIDPENLQALIVELMKLRDASLASAL